MKNIKIGVWLITIVAVITSVGPYVADWNETHIYNPNWTPHAKFHNGQTMAFGALLGIISLYFLWFRKEGDKLSNLKVAVIFAGIYWVTQAAALLFPGVAAIDPEFAANAPSDLLGLPPQLALDIIFLGCLAVAYLLERRRLRQTEESMSNPQSLNLSPQAKI
ncbi:MAG: acetyltransferase [Acidobacteriota bacterium]|nr:acetyltransferase [Acidobacteriota bacterium]